MADGIEWSAFAPGPVTAASALEQGNEAANQGFMQGQRQAVMSALRGVDLDNPDTVNSAISGLIHANAADQASALMGLNIARTGYQMLPGYLSAFNQAAGAGQSSPTAQAPAVSGAPSANAAPSAPNPAPQGSNPADVGLTDHPFGMDMAHAKGTFDLAKNAADQLLTINGANDQDTLAQRQAALPKLTADLEARGVPDLAIKAATADLSTGALKSLSSHYGDLSAAAQSQIAPPASQGGSAPQAPGAPPTMAPHPTNAWYQNLVNDPRYPGLLNAASFLKGKLGIDLTTPYTAAEKLAEPEISRQAEAAHAGEIASAQEGAKAAYAGQVAQATAAGTQAGNPDIVQTTIHGVPVQMAKSEFLKLQDANVPGVGVGLSPQQEAEQKASGERAGSLPYDVALERAKADIGAGHDFTSIPEVDANGRPTGQMLTYRKDIALSNAGANRPAGVSQSPGAAEGQKNDAAIFMKNYEADANQPAIQNDLKARDMALAGVKLAQSINPGNLTPHAADIMNTLNQLGYKPAGTNANDLSMYQNIVAQNLKDSTAVFPKLHNEFTAVKDASAQITTPGDAAALALTQTAVMHDRAAQYKQFRQQWSQQNPGQYSETQFQNAWAQTPTANQSIFAAPQFQGLKINGKPAVAIDPAPFKDGHTYGTFLPGTPHAMDFRVR